LTDPRNRALFLRHHADLLDPRWWERTQAAIRANGPAEVLSYPEHARFAARASGRASPSEQRRAEA
jgi:isocitrate dehydrogenase kinase/phosphatase